MLTKQPVDRTRVRRSSGRFCQILPDRQLHGQHREQDRRGATGVYAQVRRSQSDPVSLYFHVSPHELLRIHRDLALWGGW